MMTAMLGQLDALSNSTYDAIRATVGRSVVSSMMPFVLGRSVVNSYNQNINYLCRNNCIIAQLFMK